MHSCLHMPSTEQQHCTGCRIFSSYSPQKSPIIRGSFAQWDLQLKASYAFWPPCKQTLTPTPAPPRGHTADPTWGDISESCFNAHSSKLERLFCHVSVKRNVQALSFEFRNSFRKCHPTWDWLYTRASIIGCTHVHLEITQTCPYTYMPPLAVHTCIYKEHTHVLIHTCPRISLLHNHTHHSTHLHLLYTHICNSDGNMCLYMNVPVHTYYTTTHTILHVSICYTHTSLKVTKIYPYTHMSPYIHTTQPHTPAPATACGITPPVASHELAPTISQKHPSRASSSTSIHPYFPPHGRLSERGSWHW